MATIVYKKTEEGIVQEMVDAMRLQAYLSSGYVVDKAELEKPKKRGRKPKTLEAQDNDSTSV